jgi:hypothetical protein
MTITPLVGYEILFGLLLGFGIWLMAAGLLGWFVPGGARQDRMLPGFGDKEGNLVVTDLPPAAQRAAAPLIALGQATLGRGRDAGRLEDQLRRSGWRYRSAGDYYGSQMVSAISMFVAAALLGAVLGLDPVLITILAAAAGALGLSLPGSNVKEALNQRRDALYREMAWSLDRMVVVFKAGHALEGVLNHMTDAEYRWSAAGPGALFTALLRDIANGVSTNRDMDKYLDELGAALPALPELDEFLQAVKYHISNRKSIAEQLMALSATMRDQLDNRIDEAAQKASLQVVLISTGIILPMLTIIVGGVALINFLSM